MFAIRDYEGFEFVVDSFDLQGFQAVGFDSDLYFEKDFQNIIKPIKM